MYFIEYIIGIFNDTFATLFSLKKRRKKEYKYDLAVVRARSMK